MIKYTRTTLFSNRMRTINYPKKLFTKSHTRQRLHNELKEYIPVNVINNGLMRYITNKNENAESTYLMLDDEANNVTYCIEAWKTKERTRYVTLITMISPRFLWTADYCKNWTKEERRAEDEGKEKH